jgi:hypothetical protein
MSDDRLIPAFIPSLASVLLAKDHAKQSPLTIEEVIRIRDESGCIMLREADLRKLEESRGYRDINPENVWEEWQQLRREMSNSEKQ